jgi:hypothetical protein
MDAVRVVEVALRGTGVNLFASAGIARYDGRAPAGARSADLMPRARGVIVAASAGPELWADLRASRPAAWWEREHPLDDHVEEMLQRADLALATARVGSRRFEPTLYAQPPLDFRALGEITGLGALGPFGLLIHPEHGPWWALRAAWLVDVDVAEALAAPAPCAECAAPCVGGPGERAAGRIELATPEVRARCVLGRASQYGAEQIAYHYDREATRARLRAEHAVPTASGAPSAR